MIPAQFDYEVAGTVDEAITLLSQGGDVGDAKLLAGGQSLLPLMKLRFSRPSLLVDIRSLDGLSSIESSGDSISIGALTRHHDVAQSELLAADCTVLGTAARQIGDPQIRHLGTIGGSIAHADPAGDVPAILVALEAEIDVTGSAGSRTIAADEVFAGFFETALTPDEVITKVRVPRIGSAATYLKYNRRAQDWATVGVAIATVGGAQRVALTNMGPTPVRASAVEAALAAGASNAEAAALAPEGTTPPSDTAGSADYRAHLAEVLTLRALDGLASS